MLQWYMVPVRGPLDLEFVLQSVYHQAKSGNSNSEVGKAQTRDREVVTVISKERGTVENLGDGLQIYTDETQQ
jgi:hypothetical protein